MSQKSSYVGRRKENAEFRLRDLSIFLPGSRTPKVVQMTSDKRLVGKYKAADDEYRLRFAKSPRLDIVVTQFSFRIQGGATFLNRQNVFGMSPD